MSKTRKKIIGADRWLFSHQGCRPKEAWRGGFAKATHRVQKATRESIPAATSFFFNEPPYPLRLPFGNPWSDPQPDQHHSTGIPV